MDDYHIDLSGSFFQKGNTGIACVGATTKHHVGCIIKSNAKEIPRSIAFIEMEAIAAKYYDLIEKGRTSDNDVEVASLRKQLNELEDKFSEDPAFVALLKSERKSSNI